MGAGHLVVSSAGQTLHATYTDSEGGTGDYIEHFEALKVNNCKCGRWWCWVDGWYFDKYVHPKKYSCHDPKNPQFSLIRSLSRFRL